MSGPFYVPLRGGDTAVQAAFTALIDKLNAPAFNERTFITPLRGQTLRGLDIGCYAKTDTGTFEDWYPAGAVNAAALTTAAPAIGTLIAVPFVATRPNIIDGIAFEETTASGAGGLARVGIYEALQSSAGFMYPGALVVDGGEFAVDGATGAKATTGLSVSLEVGRVYFAAYLCGTANPTIRTLPVGAIRDMGLPATLGAAPQVAYTVASTYSTAVGLPAAYPTGATAHTTAVPAVSLRYSTAMPSTRCLPVRCPKTDKFMFRRARLLSADGWTQDVNDSYFTVKSAVRSGLTATILGTYDSRTNRVQPGIPHQFTGASDLDVRIKADATLEVQVAQYGVPMADLSDLAVETTLEYAGGA